MVINRTSSEVKDRLWHKGVEFATYQARKLLQESGITSPPFLPERLAALRGIKILKEDLGNLDSLLLPLRDGFEIKINATHSPQRQNFSCAHEIAHTFFFEEKGRAVIERLERENGRKIAKQREEDLCDIAASEILMPSQFFIKYASRYRYSIYSLKPLSRIFNTSVIPSAVKLCDINPKWCFLVQWSLDKTPELDDLRLKATWLTWSRKKLSARAGRFLFNPKIFVQSNSVLEAYWSDGPNCSQERVRVNNFIGNSKVYSQAFSAGSDRFVLSYIFPECDN